VMAPPTTSQSACSDTPSLYVGSQSSQAELDELFALTPPQSGTHINIANTKMGMLHCASQPPIFYRLQTNTLSLGAAGLVEVEKRRSKAKRSKGLPNHVVLCNLQLVLPVWQPFCRLWFRLCSAAFSSIPHTSLSMNHRENHRLYLDFHPRLPTRQKTQSKSGPPRRESIHKTSD